MRYDVEVRSHLNGGWERRYYTIAAETGDEAAARAKSRAARALPTASIHLSYTVRPVDGEADVASIPVVGKAKPAQRAKPTKTRTA